MKIHPGRRKNVLDEREMQDLYRIEHGGLWGMYGLLVAAIVVQLLMGAKAAQLAGEVIVVAVVSAALLVAYARKGIWDAHDRPSRRDNAAHAAMSAVGVAAVMLCVRGAAAAAMAGAAMFVVCYALLEAMMRYVAARQEAQTRALEDEADAE